MRIKNARLLSMMTASFFALSALTGCTVIDEAEPALNIIESTAPAVDGEFYSETLPFETETVVAESETEPEETEPPIPEPKIVSFTALGDNLIHSSLYNQARARAEGCEALDYDFEYAYAGAADLFDTADITVLNQETLICGDDKYAPDTYPCFNSPEDLGLYMKKLGVDVFTIANNHCLDKGAQGLEDCLTWYDEHDYVRVGAYHDAEDRANIRIVEKNGLKVSFLCYTESLNGLRLPSDSILEIGLCDDWDLIKSEVEKAKSISDICVVSLHWGLENSSQVEDYQRVRAQELADCGADVIIGNHPHVLREVEMFTCADGRQTICAYSLGNLISAQSEGTNLIGGFLNFSVVVPQDGNPSYIDSTSFIPVITHYDGSYRDVRLYKFSDYTEEMAASHGVRQYSRFSYEYIEEYLSSKGLWQKAE